jgi:hypothetical protein
MCLIAWLTARTVNMLSSQGMSFPLSALDALAETMIVSLPPLSVKENRQPQSVSRKLLAQNLAVRHLHAFVNPVRAPLLVSKEVPQVADTAK